MKLGVFGNIYGDARRLNAVLQEFKEHGVEHAFSLGNLISPVSEQPPEGGLNRYSRECLDLFKTYAPISRRGYAPIYFRGHAERGFLQREWKEGRNRTGDYNTVAIYGELNMVLITGERVCGLTTDQNMFSGRFEKERVGRPGSLLPEPRQALTEEDAANIWRYLKDINSRISICCAGNVHDQQVFEISRGRAFRIDKREILLEPGKSYVLTPSCETHGYAIIGNGSVKLF